LKKGKNFLEGDKPTTSQNTPHTADLIDLKNILLHYQSLYQPETAKLENQQII